MRTVKLANDIHSSALGFGCAPILGAIGSQKARRAFEVAIDCGINHFDLARSYGYGEAERFVGQALKGRRDKIVLTSKFGIAANWKAMLLRPAKPLLRFLKKYRTQAVKTDLNEPPKAMVADRFHDRIPMRGHDMRVSLERSLRALRTDYLDYFLVHEPPQTIVEFEELEATAAALKKEGKIRAWGLAYVRSGEHIHEPYLDRFDLLQFDNSPGATGYDAVVANRGPLPNVMFSTIRGGTPDLTPSEKLQKLSIDFPNSVLLCSMFDENHIRENVNAIR